ncbi:unnamed protein product, partial [Candidula unifasciata]
NSNNNNNINKPDVCSEEMASGESSRQRWSACLDHQELESHSYQTHSSAHSTLLAREAGSARLQRLTYHNYIQEQG